MARNNLVILVVGARGVGKTGWVKKNIVNPSLQPKKMIVDTFDSTSWRTMETFDRPDWQHISIPVLPHAMISSWTNGLYRIFGNPNDMFNLIDRYLQNTLLVFEDATKYIGSRLTEETKRFIYDSKQKNLDITYVFHSLASIPPELVRAADILVLFKTNEGQPSKDKYPFPEITQAMEYLRNQPGDFVEPISLRLN